MAVIFVLTAFYNKAKMKNGKMKMENWKICTAAHDIHTVARMALE